MKLWLFTRGFDYHSFYAYLVRAETKEEAWKMIYHTPPTKRLFEGDPPYDTYSIDHNPWKCQEITSDGKAEVIHASYSSGG